MPVYDSKQLHECFRSYVHGIARRGACSFAGCLRVSYATDTGLVREHNEDSFFIGGRLRHRFGESEHGGYCQPNGGTQVFGLFDGMGGEAFGEAASEISAAALERYCNRLSACTPEQLPGVIDRFAERANAGILDMLAERYADGGGSTFAALIVKDGVAYPFYIGDSRIYVLQGGVLTQLTRDHTLAQRLVDEGRMTEEAAEHSYESHILTRYLGADEARTGLRAEVCHPVRLGQGTVLLMCSDGLSDMCKREEIAAVLAADADDTSSRLVRKALDNGGYDNVTCITVGYTGKR